jgi:hypothetical protein
MLGYNQSPIFEIFKLKLKRRSQASDENAAEFELRIKYSATKCLQICSHYSFMKIIHYQQYALLCPEKIEEIKKTFEENVRFLEDWKLIEQLLEERSECV